MKRPVFILFCLTLLIFFIGNQSLVNFYQPQQDNARVTSTVAQVKAYSAAVESFREKYNALPGDFADAGKSIESCGVECNPHPSAAGDGIVGMLDLSKSWKEQSVPKTHVPATSATDESVLFWAHLEKAGLLTGIAADGLLDGKPFAFGTTHPSAKIGGGFIVGHLDGSLLPLSLAPRLNGVNRSIKGTAIFLVSDEVLHGEAELNEDDKQAVTPLRAGQIDRKLDDGRPDTGYVQAYGSVDCFYSAKNVSATDVLLEKLMFWRTKYPQSDGSYNETSKKKSCGLIFRIAD